MEVRRIAVDVAQPSHAVGSPAVALERPKLLSNFRSKVLLLPAVKKAVPKLIAAIRLPAIKKASSITEYEKPPLLTPRSYSGRGFYNFQDSKPSASNKPSSLRGSSGSASSVARKSKGFVQGHSLPSYTPSPVAVATFGGELEPVTSASPKVSSVAKRGNIRHGRSSRGSVKGLHTGTSSARTGGIIPLAPDYRHPGDVSDNPNYNKKVSGSGPKLRFKTLHHRKRPTVSHSVSSKPSDRSVANLFSPYEEMSFSEVVFSSPASSDRKRSATAERGVASHNSSRKTNSSGILASASGSFMDALVNPVRDLSDLSGKSAGRAVASRSHYGVFRRARVANGGSMRGVEPFRL